MKLPKELREKKELGKGGKKKDCSVVGCKRPAIRSLSQNKFGKYLDRAKMKYVENKRNKIYLCKKHYKEADKVRKSQEKLYAKKGFLQDSHSAGRTKYYD